MKAFKVIVGGAILLGILAVGAIVFFTMGPPEVIVYNYAGGGAPGDFYTGTINVTLGTYSVTNLTDPSITHSGTFTATDTPGLYQMDIGNYFVMLPGEMLVAQVTVDDEPRLVVLLSQALSPYGVEISGSYNWLDLSGVLGEATVTPDVGNPSTGHVVCSSPYWTGTVDADYTWVENYNAVRIEATQLSAYPGAYLYGVFVNNDVMVLDCYDNTGKGTGVNIALRKISPAPDVSTYAGDYVYLDKDGGHGVFTVNVTGSSIDNVSHQGVDSDGNSTSGTIPGSSLTNRGDGSLTFSTGSDNQTALLLPGKVIVVGSSWEGGGTLLVGVNQSQALGGVQGESHD